MSSNVGLFCFDPENLCSSPSAPSNLSATKSLRCMSMTLLHKFLLGGEIYLASATGLVIVSALFRIWHHIRGTANSRPMTPENIAAAMARSSQESRIHRWLD